MLIPKCWLVFLIKFILTTFPRQIKQRKQKTASALSTGPTFPIQSTAGQFSKNPRIPKIDLAMIFIDFFLLKKKF